MYYLFSSDSCKSMITYISFKSITADARGSGAGFLQKRLLNGVAYHQAKLTRN
jgi:hypothetical protein